MGKWVGGVGGERKIFSSAKILSKTDENNLTQKVSNISFNFFIVFRVH